MTAPSAIFSRLDTSRPLLLGGDPAASLRTRGVTLEGPAALGRLVREEPGVLAEHYALEVASGVDVLVALTSETMPRVLAHLGMAFRAAALTRCAVELAIEAAGQPTRPVVVAGAVGNRSVEHATTERIAEECSMHAARLAESGCELILAGGFALTPTKDRTFARLARATVIASARSTRLPTWAIIDLDQVDQTTDGESLDDCTGVALDEGAQLLLFSVPSVEVGLGVLKRLEARPGARANAGLLLAAPEGEVDSSSIGTWTQGAKALADAGARAVGGGTGTTAGHVAALANALRGSQTSPHTP